MSPDVAPHSSFIVVSVMNDDYTVMKITSNYEDADAYLRQMSIDWCYDNMGKNNFVDTFHEEKLPAKPGFYVQYIKTLPRNVVKKVVATQVYEVESSGWTGKYKTYGEKQQAVFMILGSDISILQKKDHEEALQTQEAKFAKEYERSMDDFRDTLRHKEATFAKLVEERDQLVAELIELRYKVESQYEDLEAKELDFEKLRREHSTSIDDVDRLTAQVEQLKWQYSRCNCNDSSATLTKSNRKTDDMTAYQMLKKAQVDHKSKYQTLLDELNTNPPVLRTPGDRRSKKERRLLLTESTDDLDEVIKEGNIVIDLSYD